MRKAIRFVLAFGLLALPVSPGSAAWFGIPQGLKSQLQRLAFDSPVLAPLAYSRFCVRNADDCRVHGNIFRPRAVVLNERSWGDLLDVNRSVNASIIPRRYTQANFYDSWTIAPAFGDCNDFAVTKRHELLARGWPSRAVLLAEVVTSWGEHHLVVVVRTAKEDFVLDNLTHAIRPWRAANYQWIRVQSPTNPVFWSSVSIERV